VPPPTNLTPETAIEITSLPYSLSVDECDGAYLFWKFTATATTVLSVLAHADEGANNGYTSTYYGPGPSWAGMESGPSFGNGGPGLLRVEEGETYWFEVTAPTTLVFSVQDQPGGAVEAGQLLITTDFFSGPADKWGVFFDPTTGTVTRVDAALPRAELGAVLESGIFALNDQDALEDVVLFTAAGAEIARVTFPASVRTVGSDFTGTFYVGCATNWGSDPFVVYTLSPAGVIGGTTWTLPASIITATEASRDGSVLFYVDVSGVASASPVHRWDLDNDEALADFAAPATGAYAAWCDIVVLEDGSIAVSARHVTLSGNFVLHYSSSGTLLDTLTYGTTYVDHITSSLVEGAVWVWLQYDAGELDPLDPSEVGVNRLQLTRLSDGEVLTTWDSYMFNHEEGPYSPDGAPQRFGAPDSCPLLMMRTLEVEPEEPEECPPLTTPVGCWTPGQTPLGCGSRTAGATGCWSGFSQDDLAIGRSS
jgi:hypothetical protein